MGKREVSLFTGAGGGVLGGKILGWEPVCFVEFNKDAQTMLKARIKDGALPDVPVLSDVRDFDGTKWKGKADVLSAGFPCQPFSVAGSRKASNDDRNMWPETIRIMKEMDVAEALLENVPGLLSAGFGYFGQVIRDISNAGYAAVWDCVGASAVAAPHRRDRLWIYCWKPKADWKPEGRSIYAKMDNDDNWQLQDRTSIFLEEVGKGDDFKGPWRRAGFVWNGNAYTIPSATTADGKTVDGGFPIVALKQFQKPSVKSYWKPYPNGFSKEPMRPEPSWASKQPYRLNSRLIWPTPLSGSNRKSAQAMKNKEHGGQSTTPGLDQAVEIANGVLPYELGNTPIDQLGPKTQELIAQTQQEFLTKKEEVIHLINNGEMTWQEGIDLLGHDPFQDRQNWPTPSSSQPGDNDEFLAKLITKDGQPPRQGERAYMPGQELPTQMTLNRAVRLWPTPTQFDGDVRGQLDEPDHYRRKSQERLADGKNPRSPLLPLAVKLAEEGSDPMGKDQKSWPTPSATDGSRGGKELDVDHWLDSKERHAKKGVNKHFHLDIAVQFEAEGRSPNERSQSEERHMFNTPNTMDHLEPREGEALQRCKDAGGRKNRKRTGNLREDPILWEETDTREQWMTPTKMMHVRSSDMDYAQRIKDNGRQIDLPIQVNLREKEKQQQTWPTPTASDWKGGAVTGNGRSHSSTNLPATVKKAEMQEDSQETWPTPTAGMWKQDTCDDDAYAKRLLAKGQQIALPGEVQLRESKRQNWPTPSSCDVISGTNNTVSLRGERFIRTSDTTGSVYGAKLTDAVDLVEAQKSDGERYMWDTPSAVFAHMEPRTGEALERVLHRGNMEGSRRKRTGNLHEDPKLWEQESWPTPSACNWDVTSDGTAGKQDTLGAQVIIRDVDGERQDFPTPTCRDATVSVARDPEKMIRPDGRKALRKPGLAEWMLQPEDMPTHISQLEGRETFSSPVTQDAQGTGNGQVVQKSNGNIRSALRYQVECADEIEEAKKARDERDTFPTPISSDWKGGSPKVVRNDGKIRDDKLCVLLEQADNIAAARAAKKIAAAEQTTFPTPLASEYKMGTGSLERQVSLGVKYSQNDHRNTAATDADKEAYRERARQKGRLNPDWVEWLMGWPLGWTEMESGSTKEDLKFWLERIKINAWWCSEPPHIPRITLKKQGRVPRLKALGNGQVPASMAAAWILLEATARELEKDSAAEVNLMDLFGG